MELNCRFSQICSNLTPTPCPRMFSGYFHTASPMPRAKGQDPRSGYKAGPVLQRAEHAQDNGKQNQNSEPGCSNVCGAQRANYAQVLGILSLRPSPFANIARAVLAVHRVREITANIAGRQIPVHGVHEITGRTSTGGSGATA